MITEKSQSPIVKKLAEIEESFIKLGKYFKTRQAIKENRALYKMSNEEISEYGLLSPWKFNLYEVFLASVPAILTGRVFDFFNILPQLDIENTASLDARAFDYESKLWEYSGPFIWPLTITITVYLASRYSLKPEHRTKERLFHARRAFLYLDGTYGLYFQTLQVLSIYLYTRVLDSFLAIDFKGNIIGVRGISEDDDVLDLIESNTILESFEFQLLIFSFIASNILVFCFFFVQRKINKKLFTCNGYTEIYQWFWTKKPPNYPPRAMLNISLLILLPSVVSALLFFMLWLTSKLAYAIVLST